MSRGKPRSATQRSPLTSRRLTRRLLAGTLVLAVVAGALWGLSRLDDAARRAIGMRERYRVRFADIACEPPPGLDRATFLLEVRYLSDYPITFQALDPNLAGSLPAAFVRHPWVASCERVTVERDGSVRVDLTYRTPALAVRTPAGFRVVDDRGILLPRDASAAGLPELVALVPVPAVSAGQPWPDDTVQRAVELAGTHHPRSLEPIAGGWRLTMPDGKVLRIDRH